MFFKFLCFFALILSWSCTKSETMPTDMTKNDTIRYLALGDSYTIGESVTTNESYPMLLAAELRGQGVSIASPKIIAKTGWTTDELSAAMDAEKLDSNYNLVSLLIGVNNHGDTVVTGGGIVGKVTKATDDELEVEIATGVKVRVVRSTVADVLAPGGKPAND